MGVPEDYHAFAPRLARYCARNPVALERMTYDLVSEEVIYRSDKAEGPTAGPETVEPLEFLARVVTHIPDPGQVMQRYYGRHPPGPRRPWPSSSPSTGPFGRPSSDGLSCSAPQRGTGRLGGEDQDDLGEHSLGASSWISAAWAGLISLCLFQA